MHGFDQSVCGCVVNCPESECMVLTSLYVTVVCPESECMVLTSLYVAVWFVQRVNAWF